MKSREFTRKITDYIFDEANKLSDKELNNLIRRCKRFTQTNCSWLEYQIKDSLIDVANGVLRHRKYMRQKDAPST